MNATALVTIVLIAACSFALMGNTEPPAARHDNNKPAVGMMMREKVLLGLGTLTVTLGGVLMVLVGMNHMRRTSRSRITEG